MFGDDPQRFDTRGFSRGIVQPTNPRVHVGGVGAGDVDDLGFGHRAWILVAQSAPQPFNMVVAR